MNQIISILKNHSIEYILDGNRIVALGVYSGTNGMDEWFVAESVQELYNWLGY